MSRKPIVLKSIYKHGFRLFRTVEKKKKKQVLGMIRVKI